MTLHAWLVILIAVCASGVYSLPGREWQKLNRKLNRVKSNFDNEIARLKFEVTDLRTELEVERERTVDLEQRLNGSRGDIWQDATAGINASLQPLQKQVKTQSLRIHNLERSVSDLQQANVAMVAEMVTFRATGKETKTNAETLTTLNARLTTISTNITGIAGQLSELATRLNTKNDDEDTSNTAVNMMGKVAKSIQLAFTSEKLRLRNIVADLQLKSGGVQQESIVELNKTVAAIRKASGDNRASIDRLGDMANTTAVEVADLQQAFEDEQVRPCCHDVTVTTPTPKPADPVTMSPGGPKVYPIFEEDLRKAIKIGSRVVRGKDWSWHEQDGVPPGAGTVIQWYGGNKTSQQVMVQWDRGATKKANYRVGAYGRYDLYLLADEASVPTAGTSTTTTLPERRNDIQQIFGPALKNAIKVGSRVVRGMDWAWGTQDGVAPGPGTVTKTGHGHQAMEVMVTWDAGRSANYRIGAHGKYDLYLLA